MLVRRQWVRLPMTDAVIARIERLALGQPSQPVFTDRNGIPIGDIAMESDDDLPGVHIPEYDESSEIPGVGSTDQDLYDNVPDLVDAFDVEDDFDIQAEPQDLIQEGNEAPDPGMGDTLVDGTGYVPGLPTGVRRSTRESKQFKQWQPSLTGKKYVFAAMALVTTQLGQSFLSDDSYQQDAEVAYAFMQQLSFKSVLKQWGTVAEDAGVKEVR